MQQFYGREDILSDLSSLWKKRVSSFVTCRGRRRVGKSTLIEKFAEKSGARFIRIEGVRPRPKMTNADELANFAEQLAASTGAEDSPPSNWLNAFLRLDGKIDDRERTVVLLDEVSWMAHYDLRFSSTLKIAWDAHLKKHRRLIFVVCGSVSTWILENIIKDGSFYGRRSLDVVVPELPLAECVKFWGKSAARIDRREIVDVLSVTGGIPRYLEEIDPGASANENIRRLAFRPKGVLREDFDEMFSDVITSLPTLTEAVLRTLLNNACTVTEIAEVLGMEKNGHISSVLLQLEEAGMVSADEGRNPSSGKQMREKHYRLRDNYVRFYLKYIEPVKNTIDAGSFGFASLDELNGWESVKGLQFENMVVNNATQLIRPLGIGRAHVLSCAPYRRKGKSADGVQIDLMIQTQRATYVIEVKRKREIGHEVIEEMERRVAKIPRKEGRSIRTAIVYEGHLAPIVEAEGYFDAIVPFRELLGL